MENFDAQVDNYLKALTDNYKEFYDKNYPNLAKPSFSLQPGPKFIRVVITDGSSRSVQCFIDKSNGDILKAAGWKAPAKGARGNIYNEKRPYQLSQFYR